MDWLEDIWDWILDAGDYLISFEWLGDAWDSIGEGVGAAFTLEDFSFLGLVFGILGVAFSYLTKYLNFTADGKGMTLIATMLQGMPPGQRIVWTILSYIAVFVAGYFVGNAFENS